MAQYIRKFVETERAIEGKVKIPFQFDGTILQLSILPTLDDVIYDFGIKDEDGDIIYASLNQKGALREIDMNLVVMPGEKFFIVENSDKEYIFRIKIIYKE